VPSPCVHSTGVAENPRRGRARTAERQSYRTNTLSTSDSRIPIRFAHRDFASLSGGRQSDGRTAKRGIRRLQSGVQHPHRPGSGRRLTLQAVGIDAIANLEGQRPRLSGLQSGAQHPHRSGSGRRLTLQAVGIDAIANLEGQRPRLSGLQSGVQHPDRPGRCAPASVSQAP